jgi:hypothetical protein|eukprot:COSAG06_NODE_5333_length_3542_cov_3.350276_1_plen_452_part_00
MGLRPSKAQCAGEEQMGSGVTPEMLGGVLPGMPQMGGGETMGGGDPLAGLGAPPPPGEGMGGESPDGLEALGLGGAPIAALAASLPNPGKWEEASNDASGVLEFVTYDGLVLNYAKNIFPSQAGQFSITHGIKMGNPQTEGYEFTTMYASQSGLMQGVTDSKFGLRGVAVFGEVLPGLSLKFMPQLGVGPNGDMNQASVELAYKGADWVATIQGTPSMQSQGEVTFNQQLSENWSAGFKLETLLLGPDYLDPRLVQAFRLNEVPFVPIPQAYASVRYSTNACTALGQVQAPFPFMQSAPWLGMFVGLPAKATFSYAHKLMAKTPDPTGQTAPGPQVSLATDLDLTIGQAGIESVTRMGWLYQLRGANVKAMVDSTWKVRCYYEQSASHTEGPPLPLPIRYTRARAHAHIIMFDLSDDFCATIHRGTYRGTVAAGLPSLATRQSCHADSLQG